MNSVHAALALLLTTIACFAQGQVNFANRVGAGGSIVDAPVFLTGTLEGPGETFTAELWLQKTDGSLTPLTPTTTFYRLIELVSDRYWQRQTVDIPVEPGTKATFVVRAWQTSLGSFDAAVRAGAPVGQSEPFVVTVGGGSLPVADLTTLKSFTVGPLPEPSSITLGLLGAVVLVVGRRKRLAN